MKRFFLIATLLIAGAFAGFRFYNQDPAPEPTSSSEIRFGYETPAAPEPEVPADITVERRSGNVTLPARSLVAVSNVDWIDAFDEPNGTKVDAFVSPTQFGSERVFRVIDDESDPDFVEISLPIKPNGQTGWVARSEVEISVVVIKALVDLFDKTLTVWAGDEKIIETTATTGAERTPTPLGTFFVRDVIQQPATSGAYGPYIIALSGFSEVFETFAGGLPAIAIHGTNNPGALGHAASNGCIRIPNELVTELAQVVPLGTPVEIVA